MYKGMQVGSVTMILADAIYCRFLVDKALQTGKEYSTDTIKNATTIDSATATATAPTPATTGVAKKGKQSGQKRSSSQISER